MSTSSKGKARPILSRTNVIQPPALEPLDPRLLLSTTLTVNTLSDETSPEDGLLSLREAITQANDTPGADTILFTPTLTGEITLFNDQLDISDDLTIAGPGASKLSISGNDSSRVLNIQDVKVAISGLSIVHGFAPLREDGGGIMNGGDLTLNRVILSENEAGYGGDTFEDPAPDGGLGGAIFNSGTLTVSNSAILDNFAGRGGTGYDDFFQGASGGEGGSGGGIYNNATLIVTNSTFAGNQAGLGGFGGNDESGFGVGGDGGDGGSGGGIANNGDATLINVTLSDNYGGFGGFAGQSGGRRGRDGIGGGIYNGFGTITVGNSLIADNDIGADNPDAAGDFLSLGHNLISASDGSSGWIASDQVGSNSDPIDARLDFLDDNGGPTPTISLLAGSPAIDAADNAIATTYHLTTDQRGYARVYNHTADIGAYEADSAYPADANHDGAINFDDLVNLAQHYNVTDGKRTWEDGDFTGDGNVNFDDLVILAQNYNTTPGAPTSAAPVAGPSPFTLIASLTKKPAPKPIFSVIQVAKPVKAPAPLRVKN